MYDLQLVYQVTVAEDFIQTIRGASRITSTYGGGGGFVEKSDERVPGKPKK